MVGHAEQVVGPERGELLSQVDCLIRRLDVIAAPGQLRRWACTQHQQCRFTD